VRWFFFKVLVQAVWWDVILNYPLLRWFRPAVLPRWQTVARNYKKLAMEMGGVLIKLGQFLSLRVDIFPPEIARELADLQDEVAPVPYAAIIALVENEFGRPLHAVFNSFSQEPLGAASLAQAYLAMLADNQEVVVKVLRPGIKRLVETAFKEARYFMREYRDLIMEMPFQLQVELLFVGRAVGILAGMATKLDPEFDPWKKTIPYARQFAKEELLADWKGLPEEIAILAQHVLKLPTNLDQVLTKTKQGKLSFLVSLSPETRKSIKRIDLSVKRFSWTVLATGLLVCGVNLHIADKSKTLGIILIVLSVVTFLWGMRKS